MYIHRSYTYVGSYKSGIHIIYRTAYTSCFTLSSQKISRTTYTTVLYYLARLIWHFSWLVTFKFDSNFFLYSTRLRNRLSFKRITKYHSRYYQLLVRKKRVFSALLSWTQPLEPLYYGGSPYDFAARLNRNLKQRVARPKPKRSDFWDICDIYRLYFRPRSRPSFCFDKQRTVRGEDWALKIFRYFKILCHKRYVSARWGRRYSIARNTSFGKYRIESQFLVSAAFHFANELKYFFETLGVELCEWN